MASFQTHTTMNLVHDDRVKAAHHNLLDRFYAFADGQKQHRKILFFIALLVQGIFFLPLPVILSFYYDAPSTLIFITMACFFTNIIAFMGGAGIRAVLLLSVVSIAIQLLTALIVII